MALETPEDVAQLVAAAVEKVKGAKPVGSREHLEAVRELRRLLSNCQWAGASWGVGGRECVRMLQAACVWLRAGAGCLSFRALLAA
jgi:hypothetical protein